MPGYSIPQQNNYNIATELRASGVSPDEVAQVITSYNLFYDFIRAGEVLKDGDNPGKG